MMVSSTSSSLEQEKNSDSSLHQIVPDAQQPNTFDISPIHQLLDKDQGENCAHRHLNLHQHTLVTVARQNGMICVILGFQEEQCMIQLNHCLQYTLKMSEDHESLVGPLDQYPCCSPFQLSQLQVATHPMSANQKTLVPEDTFSPKKIHQLAKFTSTSSFPKTLLSSE